VLIFVKIDRFTSNQDQNDHQSTHIVECISSADMVFFVIFCNL